MTLMLIKKRDTQSLAIRSNRLYAPFVALNKRCDKCVSTVVYAWEITFVRHASFLMMTYPSNNIIVMVVVFAESVGERTFFTVTNADAATQIF